MRLVVKETTNIDEIKTILCDPDIYGRITSDKGDRLDKDSLPFNENYKYIAGYEGSNILGLSIFCKQGDITILHYQVLPEYRKEYARKFALESLKFKGENPLFTITPNCYRSVINFALNLGFEFYGTHNELFTKNGTSYKQTITRLKE